MCCWKVVKMTLAVRWKDHDTLKVKLVFIGYCQIHLNLWNRNKELVTRFPVKVLQMIIYLTLSEEKKYPKRPYGSSVEKNGIKNSLDEKIS